MKLEVQDGVALLRMAEGKGNAIGVRWLEAMETALDELLSTDARALVVTGSQGFFSAGLDLPGLIDLPDEEMRAFIDDFSAVMLRLFELPMPMAAAINGHAIAGGCVLALQADRRFMAEGSSRIGLNEVQLGIGLPAVVIETLRAQVPAASLRPIALEGKLLGPLEALALGLIDQVVPAAELEPQALAWASTMSALAPEAVLQIKTALRRPAGEAVRAAGARDAAGWVATWKSPSGQARLRAAVERLRKK